MSKSYQAVTDHVLSLLRKGVAPWRCPWNSIPANGISRRSYHGTNLFLLAMQGQPSPFWLTFHQIKSIGGKLRKGSKGVPIIFAAQSGQVDDSDAENPTSADELGAAPRRFFLRHYYVFNASQVDGLPESFAPVATSTQPCAARPSAEAIAAAMPNPPRVEIGRPIACYSSSSDLVSMPPMETFDTEADYFATLFHELAHSTGHPSRLGRTLGSARHTSAYAFEELVAELTAAFLCFEAGITNPSPTGSTPEGERLLVASAAYLASWSARLTAEPQLFVMAASAAEKAAAYILETHQVTAAAA